MIEIWIRPIQFNAAEAAIFPLRIASFPPPVTDNLPLAEQVASLLSHNSDDFYYDIEVAGRSDHFGGWIRWFKGKRSLKKERS